MMTYGDKAWRDWVLPKDEAGAFIELALDAGVNFFDTADVYSNGVSEEILGSWLRELSVDREDIVIATKCFNGTHEGKINRRGLSRKHVLAACDASLSRLGIDYIDLYQIHRFDPHTPIEETLEALDHLVRVGKVLYLGASSMFAWQMAKYLFLQEARGAARFVSMQNHYNLLYREEEREMNPLCLDQGVGLIPWSPIARGYLARDRASVRATLRGETDQIAERLYTRDCDFEVIDVNARLAAGLGVSPAQTALAWLLQRPGVVAPIIGASRLSQLKEAIGAVDLRLSDIDIEQLEAPYQPNRVLGHR
jgi:aryl-alcohol dehydrogenase (NADP+)